MTNQAEATQQAALIAAIAETIRKGDRVFPTLTGYTTTASAIYTEHITPLQTRLTDLERAAANRPRIVCLCGSTRFFDEFQRAYFQETMAGRIVLSVGFAPDAQRDQHGQHVGISPAEKEALDALHLRKIELADETLVIDVDGYIGESTRREINHALRRRKPVRYWSQELTKCWNE